MDNVTTSDIRLRVATVGDAALLSRLAAALFEQTFGAHNTAADMAAYLGATFSPALQSAELADEACRVWIAEDAAGAAIGYAMLWRDSRIDCVAARLPAEIQRIYVDRAHHGQRVADALMRACIDQARAWGCDVVWLAVWERNPRAIAFYEKNHFARVGATSFQLGDDLQRDHVMARNLSF
jgi:ribosomal protein S18 acetylase RimI-like enzyme